VNTKTLQLIKLFIHWHHLGSKPSIHLLTLSYTFSNLFLVKFHAYSSYKVHGLSHEGLTQPSPENVPPRHESRLYWYNYYMRHLSNNTIIANLCEDFKSYIQLTNRYVLLNLNDVLFIWKQNNSAIAETIVIPLARRFPTYPSNLA
jgi:hypothetical protein